MFRIEQRTDVWDDFAECSYDYEMLGSLLALHGDHSHKEVLMKTNTFIIQIDLDRKL